MLRLFALAVTLACGVAAGLAVTSAAIRGEPPFGAVRSGAWVAWPEAGAATADPYARAIAAHAGRLPLPAAAGLRFFAHADESGAPLEGRCDYRVSGPTPPAQMWTLTTLGEGPPGDADLRAGFTAAEIVRGADGGFAIDLARQARPGNWLPLRSGGRFTLMFSLYDSPLGVALKSGGPAAALPSVTRMGCR